MTILIGITGGIGAGKSLTLSKLREMGEEVIDADDVVHSLYDDQNSEIVKPLQERYGSRIKGEGEEIDRRKLAQIVFADQYELEWLNNLIHPWVWKHIQQRAETVETRLFCGVPLLFEAGWHKKMDHTVSVWCDVTSQWRRLRGKGLTDDQIEARRNAQMSMEQKNELADSVIVNNSSVQILQQQLRYLMTRIIKDIKK